MSDETVSVRIVKEGHEDQDKPVKVGTVLNGVSPRTAAHLIALGVAEAVAKKGGTE